ncbi:hypothetical protein [Chryseolinea lacunae]|uniref:Uncharacterized protein n=1 Tax=Chryseolinea lacunae TaxID=2801331 RepID=A0ABS1KKA7_9BACT|nr:hypothetical protein [Chryseolinea lacunae]MBL0739890.1 hypothetical protein [Chryseolinea lacunae]
MSTRNDIVRKASLFTMNGLADPRLMPQPIAHEDASRRETTTPDTMNVWRGLFQRLFGRMSKGNA